MVKEPEFSDHFSSKGRLLNTHHILASDFKKESVAISTQGQPLNSQSHTSRAHRNEKEKKNSLRLKFDLKSQFTHLC